VLLAQLAVELVI